MAVVIRMMRAGAKKRPFYRIVVADSRRQRDGRFVEILGYYDPMATPHAVKMDEEKVKGWVALGAQPSDQAASLFRQAGIVFPSLARPVVKSADAPKAAKAPVKRAKKREVTPRRLKNKAARVKKKASPKKPKPKKK